MSVDDHGGQLDAAIRTYGGVRKSWSDLSTGINPSCWPVPEIPQVVWNALPDSGLEGACKAAARKAYRVPDSGGISLAPGSQMHIQRLPELLQPQDVAIVGFTYAEHAQCWRQAGHTVFVSDGLTSAEATARIVIVVNPNNPDGTIHDAEELLELARRLGARGGLLVIDEAFGDVTPSASLAPYAGRDGLVVLRSFGKFFGLAGLRLGFALGQPVLCERLDEALGPWPVSGPALYVGARALADRNWQTRMRKKLSGQREALETVLMDAGMTIVGGTDLFVLAAHGQAEILSRQLAEAHILVRRFKARPDWLRFGMPADKRTLAKLQKALQKTGESLQA